MPSDNLHVDLRFGILYSWINIFWKDDCNLRPLSKLYYMLHCKKLRC